MDGIAPAERSRRLREEWQIVERAAYMAGPSSGVRVSLALDTDRGEVDRLADAIRRFAGETR